MTKVMVFGTFDNLHKGHLSYFSQARKYGNFLIAVVARDKTVLKVKGKKPVHDERERLQEVKKYADKAVLGYLGDKYKVISKFKPDVICIGYDQRNFLDGLSKLRIPVKKMKAYKPHKYKSSKIHQ